MISRLAGRPIQFPISVSYNVICFQIRIYHIIYHMLNDLLDTQDSLARLEAATEAAPPAVREGVRARMAYREAAGWLAHHGSWVHPLDLAMRDLRLTGAYAAAELGTRLPSVLPATVAVGEGGEVADDRDVATALRQAAQWRRLAELRGWAPEGVLPPPDEAPALLAAVRMMAGEGRLDPAATLRAAWLWRERGGTGDPGLPIWSSPPQRLHRAALAADRVPALLGCIAEAARAGRRELGRLNAAMERGRGVKATARSHLPEALEAAVRTPILTAGTLGRMLGVSSRAGADLIGKLAAAGLLREATGRKAWRGFVLV